MLPSPGRRPGRSPQGRPASAAARLTWRRAPQEEVLGGDGGGELDVLFRTVSAGGESPHLPTVYRGLYRAG